MSNISDYIYFYMPENITSYAFLLVFKIVRSDQFILSNTIF